MSETSRALFDLLRPRILGLPRVIEVAEPKSISYHAADFFLEVLPRKHRLILLLDLDFNECPEDEQTRDASESKFFVNSRHSGGAYYRLDDSVQLDHALRLIRLAHERSS